MCVEFFVEFDRHSIRARFACPTRFAWRSKSVVASRPRVTAASTARNSFLSVSIFLNICAFFENGETAKQDARVHRLTHTEEEEEEMRCDDDGRCVMRCYDEV